jgi:hypothetical protein
VSATEKKAEDSTIIYSITGNIEHSGLERKGYGREGDQSYATY